VLLLCCSYNARPSPSPTCLFSEVGTVYFPPTGRLCGPRIFLLPRFRAGYGGYFFLSEHEKRRSFWCRTLSLFPLLFTPTSFIPQLGHPSFCSGRTPCFLPTDFFFVLLVLPLALSSLRLARPSFSCGFDQARLFRSPPPFFIAHGEVHLHLSDVYQLPSFSSDPFRCRADGTLRKQPSVAFPRRTTRFPSSLGPNGPSPSREVSVLRTGAVPHDLSIERTRDLFFPRHFSISGFLTVWLAVRRPLSLVVILTSRAVASFFFLWRCSHAAPTPFFTKRPVSLHFTDSPFQTPQDLPFPFANDPPLSAKTIYASFSKATPHLHDFASSLQYTEIHLISR